MDDCDVCGREKEGARGAPGEEREDSLPRKFASALLKKR